MNGGVSGDVWFVEPTTRDDTWANRGEATTEWIGRSTLPRASEIRRFLNENLQYLPQTFQAYLFHTLKQKNRFESCLFELVVGRTLQILGATIDVEPESAAGTRIDFEARFEDGAISVEAISPIFMAHLGETLKNRNPLLNFVESEVPEGWTAIVEEIPDLGPTDSKRHFKHALEEMFTVPKPMEGKGPRELYREMESGAIKIVLHPRQPNWPAIIVEPALSWIGSDAIGKIRRAVKAKRKQSRNSDLPTLLAIGVAAGIAITDLEDFDRALYGDRVAVFGIYREQLPDRFIPSGLFLQDSGKPTTYAGVLAFPFVSLNRVDDPTIYHHPRFEGALPRSLRIASRINLTLTGSLPHQ